VAVNNARAVTGRPQATRLGSASMWTSSHRRARLTRTGLSRGWYQVQLTRAWLSDLRDGLGQFLI